MPIKAEHELVCLKCGKKFTVVLNDAVMPKDAQLLEKPVCKKCKLKSRIFHSKKYE